jgi:hypothetical protein
VATTTFTCLEREDTTENMVMNMIPSQWNMMIHGEEAPHHLHTMEDADNVQEKIPANVIFVIDPGEGSLAVLVNLLLIVVLEMEATSESMMLMVSVE